MGKSLIVPWFDSQLAAHSVPVVSQSLRTTSFIKTELVVHSLT